MAETSSVAIVTRDWRSVALIGGVCFPASFALFHFWLHTAPLALADADDGAGDAAELAAAFFANRLQRQNTHMRVALHNMTQGLCMFDGDERLVMCNRRYAEMYNLPPDIARPGTKLSTLLEYRAAHGNFSRKVDEYRVELLASMAGGKIKSTEVKSADGRIILVSNRPMPDGGWVATHEDITERRDAEHERARHAGTAAAPRPHRAGDRNVPPARRGSPAHGGGRRHGHARDRHHAVREFRTDIEKRRKRGGRLQRSLHQCGDRGGGRRRIERIDRRDRAPAQPHHRHRARGRRAKRRAPTGRSPRWRKPRKKSAT